LTRNTHGHPHAVIKRVRISVTNSGERVVQVEGSVEGLEKDFNCDLYVVGRPASSTVGGEGPPQPETQPVATNDASPDWYAGEANIGLDGWWTAELTIKSTELREIDIQAAVTLVNYDPASASRAPALAVPVSAPRNVKLLSPSDAGPTPSLTEEADAPDEKMDQKKPVPKNKPT
jgi:hypothetical protein